MSKIITLVVEVSNPEHLKVLEDAKESALDINGLKILSVASGDFVKKAYDLQESMDAIIGDEDDTKFNVMDSVTDESIYNE
jgi:hypothetical protein